jgi:cytochrome c oxidase subunit 2
VPQLGGKTDAIPGKTNHTWFKADRVGTYTGQCAEFCGVFHEAMRATVIATSDADYQSWLAGAATTGLGRAEFQGVCATCHGMKGQGDYGPAIGTNPIITQARGLESLLRNGKGKMPAVGKSWTKQQLDELLAYLKKSVYKGAAASGG